MVAENSFLAEKLKIYIDYEYLTVEQYATIISAANNIFNELIKIEIFDKFPLRDEHRYFTKIINIPLCVEQIHTGGSINTTFSLENRFLPTYRITNGNTLNVIVPKWTAALILLGSIITYGFDQYEKYLEIKLKQLDIELKEVELEEKKAQQKEKLSKNEKDNQQRLNNQQKIIRNTNEEVLKQSARLQSLRASNSVEYNVIQNNYFLFQSKMREENVKIVEVNGIRIKDSTENNLLNY